MVAFHSRLPICRHPYKKKSTILEFPPREGKAKSVRLLGAVFIALPGRRVSSASLRFATGREPLDVPTPLFPNTWATLVILPTSSQWRQHAALGIGKNGGVDALRIHGEEPGRGGQTNMSMLLGSVGVASLDAF